MTDGAGPLLRLSPHVDLTDGRPRAGLQGALCWLSGRLTARDLVPGLVLSVLFAIVGGARRGRPRTLAVAPAPTRGCWHNRSGPGGGGMTAQRLTSALPRPVDALDDPLVTADDPLAFARHHIAEAALSDVAGRPRGAGAGVPPGRPRQAGAAAELAGGDGAGPLDRATALSQPGHPRAGRPDRAVHPTRRRRGLRGCRAACRPRGAARPAARGGLRRGTPGGRPRPPGRPDQPGPSLPRDGTALRRARLRRARARR